MVHNKYRVQLSEPGSTKVICSHQNFGTEIFWFPVEKLFFELTIVIRPYWINGYTILILPN